MCSIHNPNPPQDTRCKRPAYSEKDPEKSYCAKCGKAITSTPITCSKCEKCFHKSSCAGVIGRAAQNQFAENPGTWTCKKCSKTNSNQTEVTVELPGISESREGKTRDSLKIMQWNACYIKTKLSELTNVLHSENIDVLLVQETHLTPEEADPRINGYSSCRGKDRTTMKGGGLITYIKDSLNHEKQAKNRKNGTEVQTVRIQLNGNRWVKLTNVYCRPASSTGDEEIKFDTSIIPVDRNSIICGDFNGHSELWDSRAKPDDRGELIEDWAITNDLKILNDGSATRFDRSNGNESSPDLTLCSPDLSAKCEWGISDAIGNSDHLPIVTTIQVKVPHQTILGASSRWKTNGVDWQTFTDQTEEEFAKVKPLKSLKDRVIRFMTLLTLVASVVVGKSKPGKRSKPWFSPEVKTKVKLRNRLRRNIKEKRTEWREACRDVNESIAKAKEESWRELLDDVITDANEEKFWGVIKSLNGSPSTNARNEAMIHKGKTITSDKRKAEIFIQHYAKVSRHKFSKKERATNRRLKKLLRSRRVGPAVSSCRDFSMYELEQAIHAMRRKGAAGPDDIPPSFLKALGPHGKTELLAIFNQSFNSGKCPGIWLLAIIIPLLKAKKPASELGSYRPISLTSCIVKVLERMVANRLYHLAETNGWIHPSQAGFRKGRSCEDQITRSVQRISDGFNSKPFQRSVMVLLDFSKAYDTVWRERLLLTMADKGVPMPLIRWLSSFLRNRQARVRFNGTTSNCRPMHQGLPQGSVLAPLLFVFYINTLAEILPTNNLNCLFADDVEILSTDRDRDLATAKAQTAVDTVFRWSQEWKLNLNAAKSEVAYFTTWTKEKWNPKIMIDGKQIECTPAPRLLGVTLDRHLTFGTHVDNVCKSAASACRMLSALSNSTFGWRKQYLITIYHSMVKSKMDYSGPAWQGNIAESHQRSLERTQNRALRLITGQFKDTPVEALLAETGIPSFKTHMKRNLLISKEKAMRLDESHPRRRAYDESVPKRLGLKNDTKHNWHSTTQKLSSTYNLELLETSRQPLNFFVVAPWLDGRLNSVYPALPGLSSKSAPDIEARTLAYARIRELDAEYVIYSDGSADAGVKDGGAGAVVTFGDPEKPTVIDTLTKKGSALTSSYSEEHAAMHLALDWIEEHCKQGTRVAIATDSQSLCEALLGHGHEIKDLRSRILNIDSEIAIQWIPGHKGIEGNELADAAAKHATTLEEEQAAIPFGSACARIKAAIKDDISSHQRTARVYSKYSKRKETEVKTRADQVLLARIRSGHHWGLESYHKLVDADHNAKCEECGWELHDLEHWLCDCPATSHIRMKMFGTPNVSLDILTDDPLAAILFTRAALSQGNSNVQDSQRGDL